MLNCYNPQTHNDKYQNQIILASIVLLHTGNFFDSPQNMSLPCSLLDLTGYDHICLIYMQ